MAEGVSASTQHVVLIRLEPLIVEQVAGLKGVRQT